MQHPLREDIVASAAGRFVMSRKPPFGLVLLFTAFTVACGSNQSAPSSAIDAGSGDAVGIGGAAGNGGSAGSSGSVGSPGGPVELDGAFNARETGGLSTASGQRVRRNVIIRSGHLADLTSTGCSDVTTLALRTVIDLRSSSDANSTPDADCVVSSTDYYLADLPKLLPPSADNYLKTLDATEPKLAEIFSRIAKQDGLPAVIHCVIGRDRASLVTAIVLLSLGVPRSQVLDDFVRNQDTSVSVEAAWLEAAIVRIEGAGGIDSYLHAHGVPPEQIDKVRSMALE